MLKSFFSDLKFYFFIKAFMSLFFLLSLKIYTNTLSITEYGSYAILIFVINLCAVFFSSWLSASAIRFYPEHKNDTRLLYNTIITVSTISLLGALPFLAILFFYIKKIVIETNILIISLAILQILIQSFFLVLSGFNSAERNLKRLTIYSFSQALIALVLSLLFLKIYNGGIAGILIGSILSYSILSAIMFENQLLKSFKPTFDKVLFKQIIQYGVPLFFFNLLASILISSDQIILKYYNFNEQVGAYAANYTLIDKSLTVVTSLITVTYTPILFSEWEKNGKKVAYSFFNKILSIYIPVSLLIIVVFFIAYNLISGMILPEKYKLPSIVPYILLGSFLLNTSNIFSEIFTLNKKTLLLTCCYLLPATISIIGNIIYIPKYGIQGAAYMTSISYFILMISVIGFAIYLIRKKDTPSVFKGQTNGF
jgi:O-antigen/teichoic acid export membrane protein